MVLIGPDLHCDISTNSNSHSTKFSPQPHIHIDLLSVSIQSPGHVQPEPARPQKNYSHGTTIGHLL